MTHLSLVCAGIFGTLALTGCAAKQAPEELIMTEIEQRLKMPDGAEKISDYDRYYTQSGSDEVVGTFVGAGPGGERRWVKSINQQPAIDDGGCGVVNVIYDLKTEKVTAFCNGVA